MTSIPTADNESVIVHYEIQYQVSKNDIRAFYDKYQAHTVDYKYRPTNNPEHRNFVIKEFVAADEKYNHTEFIRTAQIRENTNDKCGSDNIRVVVKKLRY